MESNTIFRVKQITDIGGDTFFKVYGYCSWLNYILHLGDEYVANNETLDEALNQIKVISWRVPISKKTVHVHFVKKSK